MTMNIIQIPKNASNFCGAILKNCFCDQDITILVLRDPIQRFWSAVKQIHPVSRSRTMAEWNNAENLVTEQHRMLQIRFKLSLTIDEMCSIKYTHLIDDVLSMIRKEDKYSDKRIYEFYVKRNFHGNPIGHGHMLLHTAPQFEYFEKYIESKVDYVFRTETLSENFQNLIDIGVIKSSKSVKEIIPSNADVNKSYSGDDEAAIHYIQEHHIDFMHSYYAKDFFYYQNPNLLLKVQ